MKKAVLLRVGIDSGCGGIQGPLFSDGTFEFMCIPDNKGVSVHTYGTCLSRIGIPQSDFFPLRQREKMAERHIHFDPEFETFTYGDPTPPKRSLRKLSAGDLLIFYCGLEQWNDAKEWERKESPGLYIVGYFVVEIAGLATELSEQVVKSKFRQNFHVRYPSVFKIQREQLVLVKGGPGSRLLNKACRISCEGTDRSGKPLKILSPEMRKVFGDFGGKVSIQRSPPRWVDSGFVSKAISFVTDLE